MVKDISIHLSVTENFPVTDRQAWARLFGKESLGFPMLEFLTLDFTDWNLGDNEGLIVSAASGLCCFGSFGGILFDFHAGASIHR